MIGKESVLGIIPARGGSKGIPRKNLAAVGGKSLLEWTIDSAKACKYIDRLILSSDDQEIQEVARRAGCEVPFTRPAELSGDEAGSSGVVSHALESCPGFSWFVLLQPTSPLRSKEDIEQSIELAAQKRVPSVVSVTRCAKHPAWMYRVNAQGGITGFLGNEFPPKEELRRQDLEPVYQLNGAVYVVNVKRFLAEKRFLYPTSLAYVMPEERSLDVDTRFDLVYLKAYLEDSHGAV